MKRYLTVVAMLGLPGCGLIQVSGSLTGGAASPDGAAAADAPSEVPAGSGDARQAKLYKDTAGITYKTVTAEQLDITTLQLRYMSPKGEVHQPTPACGPNPDAEWIKDWPADAVMANPPVAAWIQSRINRSYAPDLTVAYDAYREQWKAFDEELESKRKAALSEKKFYDRMIALHTVFEEGQKKAKSLPAGDKVVPGALHTVATTVLSQYRDEKLGWALESARSRSSDALRGGSFANLRAWGEDAAEKKHFASMAMTGAVPALMPRLPLAEYVHQVKGQGGASVNGWLKWPEDVDMLEAAAFRLKPDEALKSRDAKNSIAVTYPTATIENLKDESVEALLKRAKPEEPKLVAIQGLIVSMEPLGEGGARVVLEQREEYSRQNCIESGPVTRISPDGYVHRQFSKCSIVEQRDTHRRFTVSAKTWPSSVDLGDWVNLYGDLESVSVKGAPRSTTVDAVVSHRLVGCFRKGDPIDRKSGDYNAKVLAAGKVGTIDCKSANW